MDNLFDSIKQGLTEAIDYERGKLPNTRVDKLTISPPRVCTAKEIRSIRLQHKLTQKLFAEALGISVKTVESWESGKNTPSGIANRMLELLKQDSTFLEKYDIVRRR